jgi:hypothetical protein
MERAVGGEQQKRRTGALPEDIGNERDARGDPDPIERERQAEYHCLDSHDT